MRNHTKVYLRAFGFTTADFIPCEVCGLKAVDIHHIHPRGMGGSKSKDVPENLMALCRHCHNRAELIDLPVLTKEELIEIHQRMNPA